MQREKEAKKAIPPHEMFIKETDKYSKFDEKVNYLNEEYNSEFYNQ